MRFLDSDSFKTTICYFQNFSLYFFLSTHMHQSSHLHRCQAINFNSFFLGLAFFITIAPLNKSIIIIKTIAIMP